MVTKYYLQLAPASLALLSLDCALFHSLDTSTAANLKLSMCAAKSSFKRIVKSKKLKTYASAVCSDKDARLDQEYKRAQRGRSAEQLTTLKSDRQVDDPPKGVKKTRTGLIIPERLQVTWYIITAPINVLFEVTTIFLSYQRDGPQGWTTACEVFMEMFINYHSVSQSDSCLCILFYIRECLGPLSGHISTYRTTLFPKYRYLAETEPFGMERSAGRLTRPPTYPSRSSLEYNPHQNPCATNNTNCHRLLWH
ncbi:hypothetical protein J6590_050631 [Homalodisca vitripennis]|nr:hypothetical protein J6590_050631 [Homalodisca vitripennis]